MDNKWIIWITKRSQKVAGYFYVRVSFVTIKHLNHSNFNKHLLTLKHKRITMDNKSSQKVAKSSPNHNML